jgi:cell division protein FtsL
VFLLLVVPLLLMLGSVYVHTVASGMEGEAARFEEDKARAEAEGERLDVRVAELSEPGRIRKLARESLGMRDPSGEDFKTDESNNGEDVANGGGAKKGSVE